MSRSCVIAILLACLIPGIGTAQPAPRATAPASPPTDRIVATVHGTYEIRQSDVDAWRERHAPVPLARLRQELYDSSRQAVDALVGEYLLAEAAARRGVSIETFVGEQLDRASTPPVREEDVREIY